MMEHVAKGNAHKIVERMLAAAHRQAASCNRIITDLATIDIAPQGLVLRELAPGVSVEEIQAATGRNCTCRIRPRR